jgi:molecular chaperone DnaK
MVQDAEKFAEEDKKRRASAEARNQADSLVHATEKQLEEHGDKVDSDIKSAVEAALSEAKTALEGDDLEAINSTSQALTEAAMKMGQQIYEKEQAEAAQNGSEGSGDASENDDVVDAEFSEVEDSEPNDSESKG